MDIQQLASKLVDRHVIYCVSSLIEGLIKVSSEVNYRTFNDAFDIDPDDLMSLCQRPDYETAVREFIFDDADLADLEAVADENGHWDDILSECVPEVEEVEDEDPDNFSYYTYAGTTEHFDTEDEAQEAAIESVLPAIREAVWKIAENYEEVCTEHGLDPEYMDVYEHWVVSSFLAEKLAEKGEVVGEVARLTVWGRCTTGQSLSCDEVIEEIARETA